MAVKIKKGDKVKVMSGKDKGKEEKVLTVFATEGKVLIENVHNVKRHTKPTQQHKGGIIEKIMPVAISTVMLVCPSCAKPTKVGFKTLKNGKKVRTCKKCSQDIDKN